MPFSYWGDPGDQSSMLGNKGLNNKSLTVENAKEALRKQSCNKYLGYIIMILYCLIFLRIIFSFLLCPE